MDEIHGVQSQNSRQNGPKFLIAGIFRNKDNEMLRVIFPQEDVFRMPNARKALDAGIPRDTIEGLIEGFKRAETPQGNFGCCPS